MTVLDSTSIDTSTISSTRIGSSTTIDTSTVSTNTTMYITSISAITDTSSTSSIRTNIMAYTALSNLLFSFYESNVTLLNSTQLLFILSTHPSDLSGCLKNCSSSGVCTQNNGLIGCRCYENFTGSSCEFDTRPCASNPCLNNSTCVNNLNYSFQCECKNTFYGVNCEKQIDLCENITCNGHGHCNNEFKCECYTSYSGEMCQIESTYVKFVRSVQLTSTLICFIFIICIICLVLANDAFNFFTGKLTKVKNKKKLKNGKTSKKT